MLSSLTDLSLDESRQLMTTELNLYTFCWLQQTYALCLLINLNFAFAEQEY